jgi:hypothetical protein
VRRSRRCARARERARKQGWKGRRALGVVLALYRGRGSTGERQQRAVMADVNGLMPLMAEEGVKRGLTGKFKARELKLEPGISMLKDGRRKWPGAVGISGGVAREKKGLTRGTYMSVTEEEKRCHSVMHKPERRAPFDECAKASRASWAERGGSGL